MGIINNNNNKRLSFSDLPLSLSFHR